MICRKFISALIAVLFAVQTCFYSVPIFADENCSSSNSTAVAKISQTALDTYCAMANSDRSDKLAMKILQAAGNCLWGAGKGVWSMVEGIKYFFELLLIEAPKWIWDKFSGWVSSAWNSSEDPLKAASKVNQANGEANQQIWDKAKAYFNALADFSKMLAQTMQQELSKVGCQPWEKMSKFICQAITEVFLVVVTPAKIFKGVQWTADLAKGLSAFVKSTKAAQGLEGMSVGEKLKTASTVMSQVETRGQEIRRFGRFRLVEYSNVKGEKYVKVEEAVKGADGKVTVVAREVVMDAKTNSINANVDKGRELFETMIEQGKGKVSVVFIDVNNLGKVNYFKSGTTAGDQYLAGVAESIHKGLREKDVLFRTGGDELVAVIDSTNAKEIETISRRIVDTVSKNATARNVFTEQAKALAAEYKAIASAQNASELPPAILSRVSSAEQEGMAFGALKEKLLAEQLALLKEFPKYRPSVSIGSSYVKESDTVASALKTAEDQAAQVKIEYKMRVGLDVEKYGGKNAEGANLPSQRPHMVRPEVRPPASQ